LWSSPGARRASFSCSGSLLRPVAGSSSSATGSTCRSSGSVGSPCRMRATKLRGTRSGKDRAASRAGAIHRRLGRGCHPKCASAAWRYTCAKNVEKLPPRSVGSPPGNVILTIYPSRSVRLILSVVLLLWSGEARAYIGPGMGVGAVVATLGVVLAFLLLLIAVVWYPIKRLWNRLFRRKT